MISITRGAEARRLSLPLKFVVSACALFLCCFPLVPGVGAQASQPQQQAQDPMIPQQPVAPLPANGSVGSGQQSYIIPTQNGLPQTQPDTHALSGVEELTDRVSDPLDGQV